MDFGFRFRHPNRTEEGFCFGLVQPKILRPNRRFFFFEKRQNEDRGHLCIHHLQEYNSPSSLMDHLYIHHLQEYNSQTTQKHLFFKTSWICILLTHSSFSLHRSSLTTERIPGTAIRHVGGQPFHVVETTRTSLPDSVTARSSLLGNPRYVLTCWTFVLSHRTSRRCSEVILIPWQLDSCSLHVWNTTFTSKD